MISTINFIKKIIEIIFKYIDSSINKEEMYTPVFQNTMIIIQKIISEAKENIVSTSNELY